MKALSSDHSSLVSFGLMIDQLFYSHVKRECNSVAHCLARYVFDSLDFLVWMENVLPQFSVVIQAFYQSLVRIFKKIKIKKFL